MGRPSLRNQRRAEVVKALARVLGTHGLGGATIAAVAAEAGLAPGLIHHYFSSKQDLYEALASGLLSGFRQRVDASPARDPLDAYVDGALTLDERSDVGAARAWVGVFAEALGDPALFAKVRRMMDAEIMHVERRSGGSLTTNDASAVVACVVGSLVLGAFAPRKTAGFAAPSARRLVSALRKKP